MDIAVIGAGLWGPNLIRNLLKLPDITVHVADTNPEVAERYKGVTDYRSLLPKVEAVCIATPVKTHKEIAIECLNAGKHVFIEKPIAANLKDAQDIVNASSGKTLMIGHTFLYSPAWLAGIRCVRPRNIQRIESTRIGGIPRIDVDVLWDLGPHDVSIAIDMMEDMPAWVSYVPNILSMGFRGGVQYLATLDWKGPKSRIITVLAGKRSFVFDDQRPEKIFPRIKYLKTEPLEQEMRHFVNCIVTGEQPLTGGKHALDVTYILEAASKSNGEKIWL